ncbi:hypothetical protein FVA81_22025 [Rhizobium sp. WL3]|uniref:hypothetical protein n=1 Tax=Rhizobium sp. WL3 TaxID=2603277 RepID=UPI0011C1FD86|nr:hypothetical protein [Rhizobium sp. WL3]QEE47115.1 hypothetical protein FVA81_22025 [Rhizobium sp. WL3]
MTTFSMIREFADKLERMAACLNKLDEEWMVFGGAALALHGIASHPLKDVDVVLTDAAAVQLNRMFSWENHADRNSDRFRSVFLFRPDFGAVPVELLGGFKVKKNEDWISVDCSDTVSVVVGAQSVFIPTRSRLASIFRLCGREKDLHRARLLAHPR